MPTSADSPLFEKATWCGQAICSATSAIPATPGARRHTSTTASIAAAPSTPIRVSRPPAAVRTLLTSDPLGDLCPCQAAS